MSRRRRAARPGAIPAAGVPRCPICGTLWKHTARYKRKRLAVEAIVAVFAGVVLGAARRRAVWTARR